MQGALKIFHTQPSHITSRTKVDLFGSIVSTMSTLISKIKGTVVLTSKPKLDLRINHHLTPKKMVEEFSKKFGVMRSLPDWVHKGAMLGIQGGREKIDHSLKLLDEYEASISSVWIQDWVGMRSTLFSERLKWNWKR